MKIGIILPVARTDKYGYQYNDFRDIIIENMQEFADGIIAISSSKFIDRTFFEKFHKLTLISDKNTWFNLKNDKEIFSFDVLNKNVNLALEILKNEKYDIAIEIHINQYIPKPSFNSLKKSILNMLKRNRPYTWLYKSYQCGNLIFYPDRRLPWILNLNLSSDWRLSTDSIINYDTEEIIKIQSGNFKKYNKEAIRDVPWELTIKDGMEKYEFVIKDYRKINNTYDPNNLDNLKFNEVEWLKYHQIKVNQKTLANELLDEVAKKILSIRKENFISNILEANYEPPKKQNLITKAKKKAKEIIKSR